MKKTNQKTSQKKNNHGKAKAGVAIGAGIVAAAAGAYFLYGSKDAARNRKTVKGWAVKAKGEVLEELEKLEEANVTRYNAIVDAVLQKYNVLKTIDPKEIAVLRTDMKRHWKNIERDLRAVKGTAKEGKKVAKKTAKTVSRAARSTPKKTTK
jgi:hypothetical protein